jgi:prepilin-type N-terminal cleavage/methylation domain-containing protein
MGTNNKKSGFTLVEVMVVVTISGVLAMVGMPSAFGLAEKAREHLDLMKLYYLRDALNRALVEDEKALYNTASKDGDRTKLTNLLKSETGVTLFVHEVKPGMSANIQAKHGVANDDINMSSLIGEGGAWYDALVEARFEGVADIVKFRLDTKDNDGIKKAVDSNKVAYDSFSIKKDGGGWRTYPKSTVFISKELNNGKASGLLGITSQNDNRTNYRLTMNVQWSGRNENSRSVEVALIPNKAKMGDGKNAGGAFLTDHGVCFSTYGPIGCANYKY